MPYITPEIKKALLNLIENEGSASELSRKTGISHSTFSKYISEGISRINQANWNLIAPLLLLYLPEIEHDKVRSQLTVRHQINQERNNIRNQIPPVTRNTIHNTPELHA